MNTFAIINHNYPYVKEFFNFFTPLLQQVLGR